MAVYAPGNVTVVPVAVPEPVISMFAQLDGWVELENVV